MTLAIKQEDILDTKNTFLTAMNNMLKLLEAVSRVSNSTEHLSELIDAPSKAYLSMLKESVDDKTELETLQNKWDSIGVSVRAFVQSDNRLELSHISVPKQHQRKGVGNLAMKDLTQFADKHSLMMHLTPATDWGSSKTGLEKFYKSHDFVPNKGRNKDFRVMSTMLRHPKKYNPIDIALPTLENTPEKRLPTVRDTIVPLHRKSDEFKSKFAGSHVSDPHGNPIVAYHGTPSGNEIATNGFKDSKDGIFFTNDLKTASSYRHKNSFGEHSTKVFSQHLIMKNPYHHDHQGKEWTGTREIIEKAKNLGHDGVIINNVIDHYKTNLTKAVAPSKVFVVFKKDQILPV